MEYSRLEEAIVEILLEDSRKSRAADIRPADEERARETAISIVDEFEELLAEKAIMIPSADREDRLEEACLYGSEYYALEDAVVDILVSENSERRRSVVSSPRRRKTEVPL